MKDHVQALVDEGLVKVEKIGSGNWFWSFGGEEKHARETVLDGLTEEKARWEKSMGALQDEVAAREVDLGGDVEAQERTELTGKIDGLKAELARLKEELEGYGDADPGALDAKRAASAQAKDRADRWTENCWTLEGWLRGTLGVDREALDGLQKQCYGDEYIEGEGLGEW